MNNKGIKKLFLISFILVSISILLSTAASAQSTGEEIATITGGITNIKGMVITLDKTNVFYPAIEVDVPDWAIVSSIASLSYYVKNYKNYYYEIVKPGEKFKVKETLEREKKELN
jgi:hypothetical protein